MALIKEWQNWATTSNEKKINSYKYTKYVVTRKIIS